MNAKNVLIFFILFVLVALPGIMTAKATIISLDKPLISISSGETFDVGVIIDPQGAAIAAAQLDLSFNTSDIRLNSITEGNFLKQNGASTFFNSGTIDNSIGKALNIYGAILGQNNATTKGTFLIISVTAINSINTTQINFENVMVVDQNTVRVYQTPTPIPTIPSAGNNENSYPVIGSEKSGGEAGGTAMNIESQDKQQIMNTKTTQDQPEKEGNINNYLIIGGIAGIVIGSVLVHRIRQFKKK